MTRLCTDGTNFYPRSPCGERQWQNEEAAAFFEFLSTLSLRRATKLTARHSGPPYDFYPRSPCGERHQTQSQKITSFHISIHALLAESDALKDEIINREQEFLSTLSLRRATAQTKTATCWTPYFYPRSPCGERLTVYS